MLRDTKAALQSEIVDDLTGKPVRIVAQAFHYAGYQMTPDDLREWVSQALRCGASAVTYYEMDSPRWTDPARWKMMLHLSSVITRMNRVALPATADTPVLYTLYTHMSHVLTARGLTVDAVREEGADAVLDIDVPANRPDCLGHLGLAREMIAKMGDRLPQNIPEVYAWEQVYLHDEPERRFVLQAMRIATSA